MPPAIWANVAEFPPADAAHGEWASWTVVLQVGASEIPYLPMFWGAIVSQPVPHAHTCSSGERKGETTGNLSPPHVHLEAWTILVLPTFATRVRVHSIKLGFMLVQITRGHLSGWMFFHFLECFGILVHLWFIAMHCLQGDVPDTKLQVVWPGDFGTSIWWSWRSSKKSLGSWILCCKNSSPCGILHGHLLMS